MIFSKPDEGAATRSSATRATQARIGLSNRDWSHNDRRPLGVRLQQFNWLFVFGLSLRRRP